MDKSHIIALFPTLFFVASEIVGLNPRWQSNSLLQSAMSIGRVLITMFIGKIPEKEQAADSPDKQVVDRIEANTADVSGSRAE